MRATAVLKERGVPVQHMHVSTLKPFTGPTVVEALKKCKYGIDAMHLVQAVEELTGRALHITEEDLAEERFVDFLEV